MADIMTDFKLIVLIITYVMIIIWLKDNIDKHWIPAIIIGTVMTYLIFQHELLAIIAFVIFFASSQMIEPFLKSSGILGG